MTVGDPDVTLTAVKTPNNSDKPVTWTSDHSEFATVTNGVVHAVAVGSATIKATCDGKSDTCAVTVSAAQVQTLAAKTTSSTKTKTTSK